MRPFFGILILFVYLIPVAHLNELSKLPVLLEHFAEHKEKNNRLSFLNFIYMHYAQSNDHDGDDEKDRKLPFKSHERCVHSGSIAFVNQTFESFIIKPLFPKTNSFCIHSEQFLSFAYLSSIWQPPKFC